MIIKEYQDNYLEDVIRLFVEEYKVNFDEYRQSFIHFFEHPFQQNRCIRIIAIDEEGELMGFQSFFYWPYARNGKLYTTYQSGSSIVSKKARGKGVFQKMLTYVDTIKDKYGIDFFVGFPVEASYKSFMSNGWDNPFDLHWYAKVKNPMGFLFSWLYPGNNHMSLSGPVNSTAFRLENSRGFLDWRQNFQKDKYRVFTFSEGSRVCEVNHKINKRKRIFNELIIGEIFLNSDDDGFITRAFKKYHRWLFFQLDISLVSFCTNNAGEHIARKVIAYGLKGIDRKIYFITKHASPMKSEEWLLYRSDIDTW
jgi:hypothetical protein